LHSILVVRRDNIGDLVCTTPLFSALRRRYPQAWIGALVNSYNAPVLDRNPDLDGVVVYTKLKHLEPGDSRLGTLARRLAGSGRCAAGGSIAWCSRLRSSCRAAWRSRARSRRGASSPSRRSACAV
jgi:ADP-heptose:LPS heptosyltransferase